MTVGIAVPVLNNFKGFAELMHSLSGLPIVTYVYPNWESNHGVSAAWNSMIADAVQDEVDELIVVNDDVVFRPEVIPALRQALNSGYDLASPTNETGVCHPHGLNFWCFAIKPVSFTLKFGEFDENFTPAYYEDDDMAYRIRLLGGRMVTLPVSAHHAVMGTALEESVHRSYYEKNLAYYIEKWGGPPTQEQYLSPYGHSGNDPKYWRSSTSRETLRTINAR